MLKAPFNSLVIIGCCPIGTPSIFSCTDEIADLYALSELYRYPCWYSDAKKLATSLTGPENGFEPRSLHQRFHRPKSES